MIPIAYPLEDALLFKVFMTSYKGWFKKITYLKASKT